MDQAEKHWLTPHGMGNIDANGKHGGSGGGEFAKQVTQWMTRARRDATSSAKLRDLWSTPRTITGGGVGNA